MRFLLLLTCGWWWLVASADGAEPRRPNIVFLLSDDQGWNGLSVAMHPDVAGSKGEQFQTPNLERFAAQGMRFSAAYAPAPVCSPTRISLQTGKSPARLHWTKAAPPEKGRKLLEPSQSKHIPAGETTIGELLRKAGYATAHYGKWHIGGGGPGEHGYDESDGDTGNEQAYRYEDPNPVDIFGMAERSAAFMEKNARTGKPFYVQLSWNALHASENALKATRAKYEKLASGGNAKRANVAAITEDLDTGVGRVLAAIDRLGLADSTYVIYMSDNGAGGGGKRGGLSGGKGSVWEGGIRVPLLVRGPGVQPNSWCHVPVVGYDWFPTFADWAGIARERRPPDLDGGSLTELLASGGQGAVRRAREELVFHFPHYQGDTPHSAIRLGNLKLLYFYEDQSVRLFDLSQDVGERRDLSAERVKDARLLRDRLMSYLKDVDAQLPTANSAPGETGPEPKKRQGKKEKASTG